jgi:hypothetical protein
MVWLLDSTRHVLLPTSTGNPAMNHRPRPLFRCNSVISSFLHCARLRTKILQFTHDS